MNDLQKDQFLNEADELTVAVDGSPSLDGKPFTSVGLYNQHLQYLALGLEPAFDRDGVQRKTAVEIASMMTEIVDKKLKPEHKLKIKTVMSDKAPVQRLANTCCRYKISPRW